MDIVDMAFLAYVALATFPIIIGISIEEWRLDHESERKI